MRLHRNTRLVFAFGNMTVAVSYLHAVSYTHLDVYKRQAQIFSSAVTRKGWQCVAGYSVTMPNTYVSLPGFDVDRCV